MSTTVVAVQEDEMPIPFGIMAETGEHLPGITESDLERIDSDAGPVQQRGQEGAQDFLAISDVDPNDLSQVGWSVLFSKDTPQAVKDALKPLLEHRERQAGRLFKVFDGLSGYQPGDDARKWVERHGAALAVVDPEQGVPLYVTIVGSPEEIPFEFQYLLDSYWCVGRLNFETVDEYRSYAEQVVAYETGATVPHRKRAGIWTVRNEGDRATGLLHKQVALPLVNGAATMKPVGQKQGFAIQSMLGDDATKAGLTKLLRGDVEGGPPALLFTGSHGVAFKTSDPQRLQKQGALLCQDWPGFGPATADQMFAAEDLPSDAKVHGMIHFLFACYGGGCPKFDDFGTEPGVPPRQLGEAAIVARLPQRMLASGALACVAHVDRAWAYSFQNSRSAAQVQEFRDVMVRVLQGRTIGDSLDTFNLRWAVLSAELQEQQNLRRAFEGQVTNPMLANRWVARNDARNYVVIGDPAVRLRVKDMQA
jgi:hypothetical protein